MSQNPITDPDKIDPINKQDLTSQSSTPDNDAFKKHMSGTENSPSKSSAPSPMDIAQGQKVNPNTPPTMATVQSQMNNVSQSLGDIKTQLNTNGLKLKTSEQYLVRKKLTSAHESISGAAAKLGVEQDSDSYDDALAQSKNPLARFLSMVSDGQQQMVQAAESIKNLNTKGDLSAGDLLLVQVKLNQAQVELNYTSTILGNATSMIKTLFNIQI
jgi:hypothetical protein